MSLVPNQIIKIIPRNSNIKYYKELGYTFEKGEEIQISPEELPKGSKVKIDVICDCCGKIYTIENKSYIKHIKTHNGHNYCKDCYDKSSELKEYRQSLIEQGVKGKYGVDNIFQAKETKDKIKETLLEKYGVDNPLKCPEIKGKVEQTNLKKYGYKVALNNPEIYAKGQQTMLLHGTQKCSSQQFEIYNMIKDYYLEAEECILNKPVSKCSADISLKINDISIDIEYDCSYWHTDTKADRRRDEFFKTQGYKILRIKSKKLIPTIEEIDKCIKILLNTNYLYKEIIMPDYKT